MHAVLCQSPHIRVARASWRSASTSSIPSSLVVIGMGDSGSVALRGSARMPWSSSATSVPIRSAACSILVGFSEDGNAGSVAVEDFRLMWVSLSREKVPNRKRLVIVDVRAFFYARDRCIVGRVRYASWVGKHRTAGTKRQLCIKWDRLP